LPLTRDRRVADVETVFDAEHGNFNGLFATAALLHNSVDDVPGLPPLKSPKLQPFLVRNIFTDFKRHDLVAQLRGQGTAFTYQGRLNDGSAPANGPHDFRFTLFAASSGGNAIAGPLTNSAVAVSKGLFTVLLDFGADGFTEQTAGWTSPCARPAADVHCAQSAPTHHPDTLRPDRGNALNVPEWTDTRCTQRMAAQPTLCLWTTPPTSASGRPLQPQDFM
jgi:hypothetical protein